MIEKRKPLNLKIVACNVMWREICHYATLSANKFAFQFLPYGLHCDPNQLRAEVQKAVDDTPDTFDAILLGYGLCSKGVEGIAARKTRLVITRQCAEWLGWRYDEITGDPALLRRFVDGEWNADEFLIVEPGHQIEATYDDLIVCSR
ncbi:MAG: DUF1638 domain-containing protein [bacterium]